MRLYSYVCVFDYFFIYMAIYLYNYLFIYFVFMSKILG